MFRDSYVLYVYIYQHYMSISHICIWLWYTPTSVTIFIVDSSHYPTGFSAFYQLTTVQPGLLVSCFCYLNIYVFLSTLLCSQCLSFVSITTVWFREDSERNVANSIDSFLKLFSTRCIFHSNGFFCRTFAQWIKLFQDFCRTFAQWIKLFQDFSPHISDCYTHSSTTVFLQGWLWH